MDDDAVPKSLIWSSSLKSFLRSLKVRLLDGSGCENLHLSPYLHIPFVVKCAHVVPFARSSDDVVCSAVKFDAV